MLTRQHFVLSLALTLCTGVAPGRASVIPVVNPSFEDPRVGETPTSTGTVSQAADTAIPGWGARVDHGSAGVQIAPNATDGVQTAYVNAKGDDIYQDVGALLPDTLYTLTVSVLANPSGYGNFSLATVSLFDDFGGAGYKAADTSVMEQEFTVTYLSGSTVSGDLSIVLGVSAGSQADFDNVRLTATSVPEPGGALLALTGVALVGLGRLRRRGRPSRHHQSQLAQGGVPMNRFFGSLIFFGATFVVPPAAAWASSYYSLPTDLNPGDQYRLVFATENISDRRDATSSNIADYNSFVTTAANSDPGLVALGTTWTAIGSTFSVDARDNTDTNPANAVGYPIYNLLGDRVFEDNQDLWSATHYPLSVQGILQLSFDRTPFNVWTGTAADGTGAIEAQLGAANVVFGLPNATGTNWVDYANNSERADFAFSFYAISGVLTVPVPEPSAWVLLGLGAVAFAGLAWIRRRRSVVVASFTIVMLLGMCGPRANGGVISSLFSTGVDSHGVPLPDGPIGAGAISDPHYALVSAPAGTALQTDVFTFTGQWLARNTDTISTWIAPNQNTSAGQPQGAPRGDYDYQTHFDLTGFNPASASITGNWAADNLGFDILINGLSTGNTAPYFDHFRGFNITGNFIPGVNRLDFLVRNYDGPGDNATGLRVEILSATATSVPEPSSWVLLGLGAVLALPAMRRRVRLRSIQQRRVEIARFACGIVFVARARRGGRVILKTLGGTLTILYCRLAALPRRAACRRILSAGLGLLASLLGNAASSGAAPFYFTAAGDQGGVFSINPADPNDGGTLLAPDQSGVLQGPAGLSVDSNGNLLVSSRDNNVIPRYDTQGNSLGLFSDDAAVKQPGRSVLGPQGNMFVIQGHDGILKLNATGKAIGSLNIPNVSGAPLQYVTSMTMGPNNNLYVGVAGAQGNVLRFNGQTGQYIDTFIAGTAMQFPTELAFGPFGYLYAYSADGTGHSAIQRFSGGAGKALGTISTLEVDTMAFGPDGKLYAIGSGPSFGSGSSLYQMGVNPTGVATLEASRGLSSLPAQTGASQMKFAPNTVAGQQTAVDLTSSSSGLTQHAAILFQDVIAAGVTSLVPVDPGTLHGLAGVTLLAAVDLSTNALFTDGITLDFHFDPAMLPAGHTEGELRLFAYDPITGLQSVTSFVNFDSQTVEASTDSLGTFAIGFVPEPSAFALAALGGLVLLAWRWRRPQ